MVFGGVPKSSSPENATNALPDLWSFLRGTSLQGGVCMYAMNYTREDKNNRGLRRHICGDIILKDRVQTNIEKY